MAHGGIDKKISQIWSTLFTLKSLLWLGFEIEHLLVNFVLNWRVFRDEPLKEPDKVNQPPNNDDGDVGFLVHHIGDLGHDQLWHYFKDTLGGVGLFDGPICDEAERVD